eukprot:4294607-Pleurochrysis_carterae.AAC.3
MRPSLHAPRPLILPTGAKAVEDSLTHLGDAWLRGFADSDRPRLEGGAPTAALDVHVSVVLRGDVYTFACCSALKLRQRAQRRISAVDAPCAWCVGYIAMQANLSAILGEVAEISADPQQVNSLLKGCFAFAKAACFPKYVGE